MRAGTVRVHRGAARDLIGIDDAVVLIDLLLARGLRGEIVNVASGQAAPVDRIVDHLERRLGLAVRREYTDAGSHHTISVAKLRSLVPETSEMDFGPDYYRRVLDAYTASHAATGA